MKKKRAITLLEIMIVMILIGLIGGVVSYNLKGTLDKGKNFRSKEGAQKLEDIINLELQLSSNYTAQELGSSQDLQKQKLLDLLEKSGLVSKPGEFIKDGWGQYYVIAIDPDQNRVKVSSTASELYEKNQAEKKPTP